MTIDGADTSLNFKEHNNSSSEGEGEFGIEETKEMYYNKLSKQIEATANKWSSIPEIT